MYVLIIAQGYPTKKYILNGIFEFDQAKALVNSGCKVVYASVDIRSIRRWRKWGISSQLIEGINVYSINIPLGRIPKAILQRLRSIGLNKLYKRIVKEQGIPDIMHAHFTEVGYAAAQLKANVTIPLVITEHSSEINRPQINKKVYQTARVTYNQADKLIAVSPALVKVIKDKFAVNPVYIPNIADTDIFKYKPRDKDIDFNFISIGNLIYIKRMDLTIEAFNKAFKDYSNVTLSIFGDGPERDKLECIIKKYDLGSRVKLMGQCPRPVIADNLMGADCFVLASQTETFGVVYIEALACGVPVIATKCGGPEGFVTKERGILVPVDDMDKLAQAMIFVYENSQIYNRRSISELLKHEFGPKTVAGQLIDLYRDALKIN